MLAMRLGHGRELEVVMVGEMPVERSAQRI
jgi:hypothetical protein